MKTRINLSTEAYFIISLTASICCLSYLVMPNLLMLLSQEKTYASVDKLYRDYEYGNNYILYSYKNKYTDKTYAVRKPLEYHQFILLENKKRIIVKYGKHLPEYTVIEILGDSGYKTGIVLLVVLTLSLLFRNYSVVKCVLLMFNRKQNTQDNTPSVATPPDQSTQA